MPNHPDGFISIWPTDVLYLTKHGPDDTQFWQLSNWPQLFVRCGCCEAKRLGAYQMIDNETARQWAEERADD